MKVAYDASRLSPSDLWIEENWKRFRKKELTIIEEITIYIISSIIFIFVGAW